MPRKSIVGEQCSWKKPREDLQQCLQASSGRKAHHCSFLMEEREAPHPCLPIVPFRLQVLSGLEVAIASEGQPGVRKPAGGLLVCRRLGRFRQAQYLGTGLV